MSSDTSVSQFLKTSMRKWKFFKDHPCLPWKFSRCIFCATPLFAERFTMCVSCYELQEKEKQKQQEEEEDFLGPPCINCGADSDGGPYRGICSRSCLRDLSRD